MKKLHRFNGCLVDNASNSKKQHELIDQRKEYTSG